MDLENENIPTTVQNLSCDEQITLLTLACEIARIRSNEFITINEVKPFLENITNVVIASEDRQVATDLLSKQDRYTIPRNAFQQED